MEAILRLITSAAYRVYRDYRVYRAYRDSRAYRDYKVYRAYISFRDFEDLGGDTPSDNISCL